MVGLLHQGFRCSQKGQLQLGLCFVPRYGFSPRRVSILDKRCLTDSSVAVTLQQKIAHVDRLPVFGQAAQSIGTVLQLFFHVATSWLLYANLNLTYPSTVCLCTCQGHWQYLRERPEPALWLGDSDIRTSIASNISSSLFSSCMRFLHYFLPYYLSAYHDLSILHVVHTIHTVRNIHIIHTLHTVRTVHTIHA